MQHCYFPTGPTASALLTWSPPIFLSPIPTSSLGAVSIPVHHSAAVSAVSFPDSSLPKTQQLWQEGPQKRDKGKGKPSPGGSTGAFHGGSGRAEELPRGPGPESHTQEGNSSKKLRPAPKVQEGSPQSQEQPHGHFVICLRYFFPTWNFPKICSCWLSLTFEHFFLQRLRLSFGIAKGASALWFSCPAAVTDRCAIVDVE